MLLQWVYDRNLWRPAVKVPNNSKALHHNDAQWHYSFWQNDQALNDSYLKSHCISITIPTHIQIIMLQDFFIFKIIFTFMSGRIAPGLTQKVFPCRYLRKYAEHCFPRVNSLLQIQLEKTRHRITSQLKTTILYNFASTVNVYFYFSLDKFNMFSILL